MRRAIIRMQKDNTITVLCNVGHVLADYKPDKNFGGSSLQSDLSFGEFRARADRMAERCNGTGH